MISYHLVKGLLPTCRRRVATAMLVSMVLGAVAVAGPMAANEIAEDDMGCDCHIDCPAETAIDGGCQDSLRSDEACIGRSTDLERRQT